MSELAQIGPGLLMAAGTFLVGLGLGIFLRRGSGEVRARAERLEDELSELTAAFERTRGELETAEEQARDAHRQLAAEKNAVAKHFEQTSDLFRDLTRQYTSLYAHLAEGARELCPDSMIPIGVGFESPLLAGGARDSGAPRETESEEPEEAEAQLEAVRQAAASAREDASARENAVSTGDGAGSKD
jgi:uncharacterized membrane-anchored protein YhcB (DUF1043 family)